MGAATQPGLALSDPQGYSTHPIPDLLDVERDHLADLDAATRRGVAVAAPPSC